MHSSGTRPNHSFQGISRRELLPVGAIGLGGLTLADLLRLEAAQGSSSSKSVIMIYLCGAPPHQDMFDLKPDAPVEIRGEFNPISTNIPASRSASISRALPESRTSSFDSHRRRFARRRSRFLHLVHRAFASPSAGRELAFGRCRRLSAARPNHAGNSSVRGPVA